MRWGFIICTIVILASPAIAQQSYQKWASPEAKAAAEAAPDRLQELVDRLMALIDKARKAEAADPKFLDDVQNLARGYDRPTMKLVLGDSFSDGEFTSHPTWTVTRGAYWVDGKWGLRNRVAGTESAGSNESKDLRGGQLAAAIIGGLISKATGKQGGTASASAAAETGNAIHTLQPVANAFSVQLALSSLATPGHFAVDMFQGSNRATGYSIRYVAGDPLQLVRYSDTSVSILDTSAKPVVLEDGKVHRLEWTRGADGAMTVTIDEAEVVRATDRGFRDPFDGVQLSNHEGDFVIGRVSVHSAE